jgi:hypothetical protein
VLLEAARLLFFLRLLTMLIVPLFSALFALAAAHAAWDDKLAKLVLAPNAVARTKLLSDADHVFDFLDPNAMGLSRGRGGLSVSATGTTFPALIGQGMAATVGYLGPCGMNTCVLVLSSRTYGQLSYVQAPHSPALA